MKTKNLLLVLTVMFTLSSNAQYIKLDASFYSEALDEIKKVDIYLPSDYYVNLEQEYAVIYYLHGAGGNQNSGYESAMRYYLLHNQDTLITSPPAIFVCPDGSCEPYSGSDYFNSELYGNYGDYTTIDLIEFIENSFRARPTREFRFVCGTSMGGFGSAFHATDKPELFRASFPFIGFPAMNEDLIVLWRDMIYEDCGSYTDLILNITSCQLFLTMAGGASPNLELPPYFIEFPWDSIGALVDSVANKWYQLDASSKVRNIPQDIELPFFLGCGTTDYMGTYPLYLQFEDSLNFYGIPYQSNYFEGGHVDDFVTWQKGFHWMDSIINYSYETMGVEIIQKESSMFSIYPNPAHNQIEISCLIDRAADMEIGIYSLVGQKVFETAHMKVLPGQFSQTINISQLPKGTYLLRMRIGDEVVTKKVVKL